MNKYTEEKPCCDFHPKEVIVGVCPLCLNERLLILAAKQGHLPQSDTHSHSSSSTTLRHRISTLPKIFALGNSLFNRFDHFHHHKQFDHYFDADDDASPSPEADSFISIKFEDNGVASWEKGKVSLDHCNISSWNHSSSKELANKSVVEHMAKPRGSLRWRKRIGHLFQLSRWKRSSSKGNVSHVGTKLEGVKVRSGWIRTLTKRRTKE